MGTGRAFVAAVPLLAVLAGAASAQARGVQFTPDGKRVLVNKDVENERWAITRNENGTVTGNVFRSDGGPPAFVFCVPLQTPDTYSCFGADACTDASGAGRGIQAVPDETRVLIQKDVGSERWAISLNFDDGTATGNVFRADGGPPAFLACTPNGAPDGFSCAGADECHGLPCDAPFTPLDDVTLPPSFFAVPDPCNETYGPLGDVALPADFFEPPSFEAGATVAFQITAGQPVQGFDLRVTYSTARGTFLGSHANVSCTTDAAATFLASDNDQGRLTLLVAGGSNLTFPIAIRCGFSADIAASDLTVEVHEVTQNNGPGDATALSVGVTVEPAVTVTFDVNAGASNVQGFDVRITYPASLGTFVGAGENVRCTTDGPGLFTKNATSGGLVLILSDLSPVPFPVAFRCGFDAHGEVAATDFAVVVREVTQNGTAGDPSVVSVGVTVH